MNVEEKFRGYMEDNQEGNIIKGCMWATVLSVPLWISLFGWIKIIGSYIS